MRSLLFVCLIGMVLVSCDKKDPEPVSSVVDWNNSLVAGDWTISYENSVGFDSTHQVTHTQTNSVFPIPYMIRFTKYDVYQEGYFQNNKFNLQSEGSYVYTPTLLIIKVMEFDSLYTYKSHILDISANHMVLKDTVHFNKNFYRVITRRFNK